MTTVWILDWFRSCFLYMILFQMLQEAWTSTVYMDKFGDCNRDPYVEVDGDAYTILSQGGEAHDNLRCSITFRSVQNNELCVSFKELEIKRCNVYLSIFSEQSASGNPLKSYSCHYDGGIPEMVCSEGKYITVQLRKNELSRDGYYFSLELRERNEIDRFADGLDAFIMSIGVIIAIIVGVIVLVVIIAVIVVYCCCKQNRHHGLVYRTPTNTSSRRSPNTPAPAMPSAPPFPAEEEIGVGYHGSAPPAYSEQPPPYLGAPATEKVHV